MTLDQVMDLQYRKLLTARDTFWQEMEPFWVREVDPEEYSPNIFAVGALMLLDLDRLDLPELEEEQREMLEPLYETIRDYEDMDTGIVIPLEYRLEMLQILETNRISDEWNRELALKAAAFANRALPALFIGEEHLAEIL